MNDKLDLSLDSSIDVVMHVDDSEAKDLIGVLRTPSDEHSADQNILSNDIDATDSVCSLDELPSQENLAHIWTRLGLGSKPKSDVRIDTLHVRGTQEMSTEDVMRYFEPFAPVSVEWISDHCCNVMWKNAQAAAQALLGKAQAVVFHNVDKPSSLVHGDNGEDSFNVPVSHCLHALSVKMEASEVSVPVPPGIWVVGRNFDKAKTLLLRFATRNDRKVRGGEKLSLRGKLSTSRKRKLRQQESNVGRQYLSRGQNFSSEFAEDQPVHTRKVPRMRMYADEELPGTLSRRLDLKVQLWNGPKEKLIHPPCTPPNSDEEEQRRRQPDRLVSDLREKLNRRKDTQTKSLLSLELDTNEYYDIIGYDS